MPELGRDRMWIVAGPEFQRVANRLREEDARLPTRFERTLGRIARVAQQDVQRRVRRLELPGGPAGSTGLRRRVARGVGVRINGGRNPSANITTSMADPSEAVIPLGMDTPRGWRHPVFGNMSTWVRQPGLSWFREPISSYQDEFESALTNDLEESADTIADAGSPG